MVTTRIIQITDTFLELDKGDEAVRVNFSDIPGNGWPRQRLDRARDRLQNLIDVRQPLSDLPDDDRDKTIDPARPDLFWDGDDLVGRSDIVTKIEFIDGRLLVALKRAR